MDGKTAIAQCWVNEDKVAVDQDGRKFRADPHEGLQYYDDGQWETITPSSHPDFITKVAVGTGWELQNLDDAEIETELGSDINAAINAFCSDQDKIRRLAKALLKKAEQV